MKENNKRNSTSLKSLGLLCCGLLSSSLLSATDWAGRQVVDDFHADLSASFNAASGEWTTQLDLGEFNDPGLLFDFDDVLLVVTEVGRDEVFPEDEGTFWGDLGEAGTLFWVIPVNSENGLIHLGFNAYGVAPGVMAPSTYPSLAGQDNFPDGRVDFVLRAYDGPGTYVVFRTGQGGAMQVYMDSRELGAPGVDNLVPERSGGHSHMFMLFVGRGLHSVTMRNEGVLASNGQTVVGPDRAIPFVIAPRGRHWWLLKHFDFEDAVQLQAAMDAPPSAGGSPLLIAYAFGLDPIAPDLRGLPQVRPLNVDGIGRLAVEMRRPSGTAGRDDREDLEYVIEWSEDLSEWQEAGAVTWESLPADSDGTPRARAVIEDFTLDDKARAFARVRVRIGNEED